MQPALEKKTGSHKIVWLQRNQYNFAALVYTVVSAHNTAQPVLRMYFQSMDCWRRNPLWSGAAFKQVKSPRLIQGLFVSREVFRLMECSYYRSLIRHTVTMCSQVQSAVPQPGSGLSEPNFSHEQGGIMRLFFCEELDSSAQIAVEFILGYFLAKLRSTWKWGRSWKNVHFSHILRERLGGCFYLHRWCTGRVLSFICNNMLPSINMNTAINNLC